MRDKKQSWLNSNLLSTQINKIPFQQIKLSKQDLQNSLLTSPNLTPQTDYLYSLLVDLKGIQQNPHYHPERDALYHSLQVFQLALEESQQPVILAAALFHDIGKANSMADHAIVGAEMVRGILSDSVVWLIEHHLDLMYHPKRTRKRWRGNERLNQLEQLRRLDIQGRQIGILVPSPMQAIQILNQADEIFTPQLP